MTLGDRMCGIVGDADIRRTRPGACLVNTSRAALVDGAALVAALAGGRIADAGLDMFNTELVPPDAPILSAPNTILTPHLGCAVRDGCAACFPQVLEAVEAWLDGAPTRLLTHG